MAQLIGQSRLSARPVVAYAEIVVDMVDYTIRRAIAVVAAMGADFDKHGMRIVFPASSAPTLTLIAKIENLGNIGGVAKMGFVGTNGTRELDEGVIEHNFTGTSAPGGQTTTVIETGDIDGGQF